MKSKFLLTTFIFFLNNAFAQIDISPYDIISFKDSCGVASDTVCVRINNTDTTSKNYSVAVSITGDTTMSSVKTGLTVADSGKLDTIKFNDMVLNTLKGGTYYLQVVTSMGGDPNSTNDILRDTVTIYPLPSCKHRVWRYQYDWEVNFEIIYPDTNTKYEWQFGDGGYAEGDTVIWEYSFNAIYIVNLKATNQFGCTCSVSDTVRIKDNINRIYNSDAIKVYPNPNNGVFIIEFVETGVKGDITIYNSIGVEVYKLSSAYGVNAVDISSLPQGIYTIAVWSEGVVYTYKINVVK